MGKRKNKYLSGAALLQRRQIEARKAAGQQPGPRNMLERNKYIRNSIELARKHMREGKEHGICD